MGGAQAHEHGYAPTQPLAVVEESLVGAANDDSMKIVTPNPPQAGRARGAHSSSAEATNTNRGEGYNGLSPRGGRTYRGHLYSNASSPKCSPLPRLPTCLPSTSTTTGVALCSTM